MSLSGIRGEPPPATLKVAINEVGGYRNTFELALTGLDIDAKASFAAAAFWEACPHDPEDFAFVRSEVVRTDRVDAGSNEAATAVWRVTVKDPDGNQGGAGVYECAHRDRSRLDTGILRAER